MGEKFVVVSFIRIMKIGYFCLCGYKMVVWLINYDYRYCLFYIGIILKLKVYIYEMDE